MILMMMGLVMWLLWPLIGISMHVRMSDFDLVFQLVIVVVAVVDDDGGGIFPRPG